jgi:ribonucleoside-diphosphate reductase alpha chain
MDKLVQTVETAIRFLDDVIDANDYPLEQIKKMSKGNRKIGLGVMGFADVLFKLNIPYDSEAGLNLARRIMKTIEMTALGESEVLALERGRFPNWSAYNSVRRNATVTTIAPTGSISIIAGCSSGIEPIYGLVFKRHVLGKELFEVNKCFKEVVEAQFSHDVAERIFDEVAKTGSCQNIDVLPEEIKKVFVTAHDISPLWHVRMQAAFQLFVDNAVSKTVNMPHDATIEDVKQVFLEAYRQGCKGITIYRDRSRENQVLT